MEDISPEVTSCKHAHHPHISVMSSDSLQFLCHLSKLCCAAQCELFDTGLKQVWPIVSRAPCDRTYWCVHLLVCCSWVVMAPGPLEIQATFRKAWHRQTYLGHNGSAQHRAERKDPTIITATRHRLSSVKEYKCVWNKACCQMGDISNWTT